MKTIFKLQDSSIVLKTYEYQVLVYPGMPVMLNNKKYTIQQAILALDQDVITVEVQRASTERS